MGRIDIGDAFNGFAGTHDCAMELVWRQVWSCNSKPTPKIVRYGVGDA
jgi:hypothetical protein